MTESEDPMSIEDAELEIGMNEVDNELDEFPPQRDYIEHLPFSSKSRTFSTLLLENEHKAIEDNEPRSPPSKLSVLKFDLPPANSGQDDIEAWNRCINQLKIRLEYGQRQMMNLELMKSYGNLAWEQCLKDAEAIESILKSGKTDLKKQQQLQEELDWRRKTDQELIAKQLEILQNEFESLEERNRILSEAIRKL